MKSFLVIASVLIVASIACSGYKSAGSQSVSSNPVQSPSPAPTNTASAANTANTQEKQPCTLTLAPAINGLRLGMTSDEALALFPGSKEDADISSSLARPGKFGVSEFMIRPAKYESREKFAGLNQIVFRLLDGRVASFHVGYNGPEYSDVDMFIARLSKDSNLPAADAWDAYVGMDTQLKTLKCANFEIRAFAGGQGGNLNYVEIRDLEADKKLKDRKAKAKANATPTP